MYNLQQGEAKGVETSPENNARILGLLGGLLGRRKRSAQATQVCIM